MVLKGFVGGFRMPLEAIALLCRRWRLMKYAAIPMFLNLFLYGCVISCLLYLLSRVDVDVVEWEFWGGFGAWLSGVLNGFAGVLKWVMALPVIAVVCYFSFVTVGMIIASPVNDLLAERVEQALCGSSVLPKWSLRLMLISLLDSVWIAGKQFFLTVLTLPFLLIPFVGAVPFFLVSSYFGGMGFLSVSSDIHGFRRSRKRVLYASLRWEIFGLGVAMQLLFLIPFMGLLLLPIGVTAGSVLFCGADWDSLSQKMGGLLPPGFVPPKMEGK